MDYSVLIEYLRQQQYITDLERDILDTANELQKAPFDRVSAELQVKKNNICHPELFALISALPTSGVRPFIEATDADILYSLNHQLDILIVKELEALTHGK